MKTSDFGMPFLLECNSPERCAALCAELKLDFVELNISFPACGIDRLSAASLNALRERYGLYFTLHMDEEAQPFAFNPMVRQAWLETFRRTFDLCAEAGIPVINMHMPRGVWITLPSGKVFMCEKYADDFHAMVDGFRAFCEERLAGSGTVVCVENTNGWLPFEREAIERLLPSPVIGLTLDIGHSEATGDADIPFFEAHDAKLWHMHAHDAEGKRDHQPLGRGRVDLRQRLGWALRRNARVLLEIKTVEALRESVAVVGRYLPEDAAARFIV